MASIASSQPCNLAMALARRRHGFNCLVTILQPCNGSATQTVFTTLPRFYNPAIPPRLYYDSPNLVAALLPRHDFATSLHLLVTLPRLYCNLVTVTSRCHDFAASPRPQTRNLAKALQPRRNAAIASSHCHGFKYRVAALLPCYVASSRRHGFNCLVTASLRRHRLKQPSQCCHESFRNAASISQRGYELTTLPQINPQFCHDPSRLVTASQPWPHFCNPAISPRLQLPRRSPVTASQPRSRSRNLCNLATALQRVATAPMDSSRPRNLGHGLATSVTVSQPLQPRHGLATGCHGLNRLVTASTTSSRPRHNLVASSATSSRFQLTRSRPCNLATIPQPRHGLVTTSIASSRSRHLATVLQPRNDLITLPWPCNLATASLRLRHSFATALQPPYDSATSPRRPRLVAKLATSSRPCNLATSPQLQLPWPCDLATILQLKPRSCNLD
ncbi:hypothetical protein GGR50DRAFT_701948 [Xylaria sp. CBS 124048]|nr:hypothetical protein GGR50DRAFT_701948 [Xylaria sp. CBS 124048]